MGTGQELRPVVLLVDDKTPVRAVAARALTEGGFAVLNAVNAIDALALMNSPEAADLRLVLTDIRLPGMTGDDLGRLLHHLRPGLPVLYMSGLPAPPTLDFLSPTEIADCWLAKPFSLADLVTKVREHCDGPHRLPYRNDPLG